MSIEPIRAALRRLRESAAAAARELPEQVRSLRQSAAAAQLSHEPWLDRAVVLGFAVATGLAVVGFTLLCEAASHAHSLLARSTPWAPWLALLWVPLLTAALVWLTRRFAPGAAGSGIPQVIRALDDEPGPAERKALVSPRLSVQKIALVAGGLLAGLSIGREGPTAQVGAGLMVAAKRWLSPQSRIDEHDLMVAGAAAGIAAAFNTPLGGIVFGLEELSRRRGTGHSTLVIAVIVLAGLVSVAAFGNETYFGTLESPAVGLSLLWPATLVAVISGVAGGTFSRLLVRSLVAPPGRIGRLRQDYPYRFVMVCAFAVALIGLVTRGQTDGAGYAGTRALLEAHADVSGPYTILKFCANWLSAWTGIPGGLFAPALAVGAGIGNDVARLTDHVGPAAVPLIALGMAGFLAAVTQAPITSFIIVMEMVSGQPMVLSLMACTMLAAGISRLIATPLYATLAHPHRASG